MLRFLRSAGILAVTALLIAGCSKSNPSSSQQAPKLTAPAFSGPAPTTPPSDTSSGYMGYSYATSVAGLFTATAQGYMSYYTGSGTQSGDSWTWTYSANGFTATWTAALSGSSYNWKLVYNGTDNGVPYSNWTALSGTETTDGKSGSWTIFYPPTTVAAYQLSWSTASNGTLTGTILMNNDTTGAVESKQVFTNNTDKSGELVVYYGNGPQKEWDITWAADGSGEYTMWDEQGNVIGTGKWS